MFQISCFADEISPRLDEEIKVMASLDVKYLSLRAVDNIGVLDLSNEKLDEIARLLEEYGVGVSSIGSPIGKTQLSDTSDIHMRQTERAIYVAHRLNCPRIRVFSFYVDREGDMNAQRDEVISRLKDMTELAASEGVMLMHENEAGIYGESSAHCREILEGVNNAHFKAVFDASNFVAAGEAPFTQSLPNVKPYVAYMHIKDSRHSDGVIVPAGEGDGQLDLVLRAFADRDMFLTLEPHLIFAGRSRGFTGGELFRTAHTALTGILKKAGLAYR